MKARFRAQFKAQRKARLIAPRRAWFKARGEARERPYSKAWFKARRKARFKAQSKARFEPRSEALLKAAQGAVPPPWGGRENCGSGCSRPLHIDVTSPWPTSHLAGCRRSRLASRCRTRHSHRDCGVHFGSDFSTKPRIRPATDCATCLAIESVSESASHGAVGCRTRPRTGCRADGAVDCTHVCRADFGVLPRVGSGLLSGAEVRAKSLIDGHIDGRVVFGIECRSHPRIDPPVASASAGSDLGPQAAGWDRHHSGR